MKIENGDFVQMQINESSNDDNNILKEDLLDTCYLEQKKIILLSDQLNVLFNNNSFKFYLKDDSVKQFII